MPQPNGDPAADGSAVAEAERTPVCVFAPVLLLTITLETRGDDELEIHVHCGGQGYWQARMARVLGADPILCTILGGETGQVLQALVEEGIDLRCVTASHPSAAYIHDRRGGERREIARTSPTALGRHEQDELHNLALGEAAAAGVCVLAGTHENTTLAPEVYERLTADLSSLGVAVLADITGDLLRASLKAGLDVVKLSHEELIADGWATGEEDDDIRAGIDALRDAGARNVVVSRQERGLLAWYEGQLLRAKAPELSVVDPRGAGDSMTAALTVARRLGLGASDALQLATAAAAVNVTRHGLASGDGETVRKLVPHVVVEQIS